ncbi:MAG: hydroxyacid dehydrogenase [Ramlibacter sp.]|uniref:hydroxyacid dehydrogenase n=1 Tax=Ramlibacter sp. TaxID=1917967 RepID=UPI002606C129|nr:hydroxyacid dehydrogenase [Ramlibacter sp.]MDH4377371.1 hydroxyacid dehydrogenase [Ramlibacter sp.]
MMRVLRLDTPLDAHTFDSRVGAAAGVALQVHPVHGDEARTWAAFHEAHVYHIASARDDLPAHWLAGQALLERSPQLLAVSAYGAGYDTVDVAACTAAGVCVMNQAGSNAAAVAEHTIGLLLGLSKRIAESDRRLRRGERFTRQQAMGSDLQGAVLGLVGIGHAGTRVAALGRALGMRVLATDPYLSPEEITHRGAQSVTLQQLLQDANVISLHCPLTPETEGLLGRSAFAAMKPGALFITTARGGIHDEVALYDALVSGHLAGAGLDVWAVEPPPADHPLLRLDQVLATTHTAGVSAGARRQMAAMSADQILAFARGERPARLVNPQVWPAFIARYERVMGQPFAGAGALHGN